MLSCLTTIYYSGPSHPPETVVRRPWRTLDIADFRSALLSSILCQPDRWLGLDADAMTSLDDTELTAMLDHAVPARTVTRRPRPSDPWFDAECRAAKRLTRVTRPVT